MSHEQRMADAGIELPEGYPPAGLYVGAVRVGNLLHIGGHGPVRNDGSMVTGKVGDSVDLQAAQAAAALAQSDPGAARGAAQALAQAFAQARPGAAERGRRVGPRIRVPNGAGFVIHSWIVGGPLCAKSRTPPWLVAVQHARDRGGAARPAGARPAPG